MTEITSIDSQKLLDLRNVWLAKSEAEMEALKQLDTARAAVQKAQDEFQAYARGGEPELEKIRTQDALIAHGQKILRPYDDECAMTMGYPTSVAIGRRIT